MSGYQDMISQGRSSLVQVDTGTITPNILNEVNDLSAKKDQFEDIRIGSRSELSQQAKQSHASTIEVEEISLNKKLMKTIDQGSRTRRSIVNRSKIKIHTRDGRTLLAQPAIDTLLED